MRMSRNVPQAANIYLYLSGKLGMEQYVDGIPSIESRTIEMFHRSTEKSNNVLTLLKARGRVKQG